MVGKHLRAIRKSKGFSQKALAKTSGLSNTFICDIEKNRVNPSIATLLRLAEALGVKPDSLLFGAEASEGPNTSASSA